MAICLTHGYYTERMLIIAGKKMLNSCPKCAMEKLQKNHKEALREKVTLDVKGMPTRYKKASLRELARNAANKDMVRMLVDYVKCFTERSLSCPYIAFLGDTDCTEIACAFLSYAAENGLSTRYTAAHDYINLIRATYGFSGTGSLDTELSIAESYRKNDLLVIDGLELIRRNEDDKLLIQRLIEGRFSEALPTVLVVNGDEYKLSEMLGGELGEKIRTKGHLITKDKRPETANTNMMRIGG